MVGINYVAPFGTNRPNQAYSTGTVRGDSILGGIVANGRNVTNCYSTMKIYGKHKLGGIVGIFNVPLVGGGNIETRSYISNCYFAGEIHAEGVKLYPDDKENERIYKAGGIAGSYRQGGYNTTNYNYDTIKNCVMMGNIYTPYPIYYPNANRIMGSTRYDDYNRWALLYNNYGLDSSLVAGEYIGDTAKHNYVNGENKPMEVLKKQYFYEEILGWDFDSVWMMCENYDYPIFQWMNCESAIKDTSKNSVEESSIKLFPNPVGSELSCEFILNKSGNIIIEIIDLEGKLVSNVYNGFSDIGLFSRVFRLQNISKGSYLLRLSICGTIRFAKFIKE